MQFAKTQGHESCISHNAGDSLFLKHYFIEK